jgi:3-hydroxy acid dehydrogenase / malonic semialdehyde reductase
MTRLVLQHSLREPGHIVNIGSVAGRWAYPNGATYVTSKFAVRGFTRALREDLLGRDIRVTTVDAGLVETEFSIVRFRGDADKAKAVYEGTRPLIAEDVADCIMFALTRPLHVVVDELVLMTIDQSSGARVHRRT